MITKAFQECLTDVYRGEIIGEAAFDRMLGGLVEPEQKYIIGSLLQFETEGKAIVRPLLVRLGLPIGEDAEAKAQGLAGGTTLNGMPWIERFAGLRDTVKSKFLPRYAELATLVSAEDEPEAARVAKFMAEHERALVALAENVVAGNPNPAAPATALLHFPLPRPV
jgi:hypothetical protein